MFFFGENETTDGLLVWCGVILDQSSTFFSKNIKGKVEDRYDKLDDKI